MLWRVVADDEIDAHPQLVGELANQLVDAPRAHGVERRGRLVEEDVAGVEGERAGDGDALPEAVAELGRVVVGELAHAHRLEAAPGLVEGVAGGEVSLCLRRAGATFSAQVIESEERRVLEDHRALLPHVVHVVLALLRHVLAVEPDLALVGPQAVLDAGA